MIVDLPKLTEIFKEVEGVFALEVDTPNNKVNVFIQSRYVEEDLKEVFKELPQVRFNTICALPRCNPRK
jgi:hypothetical protein